MGYEEQQDPSTLRWRATHVLVANQNPLAKLSAVCRLVMNPELGRYLVVHHKDFDKLNNSPNNLEWLGDLEHIGYHSEHSKRLWLVPGRREQMRIVSSITLRSQWKSPQFQQMQCALRKRCWGDDGYRHRVLSALKANGKKLWENATHRAKMSAVSKATFDRSREKLSIILRTPVTCEVCGKVIGNVGCLTLHTKLVHKERLNGK